MAAKWRKNTIVEILDRFGQSSLTDGDIEGELVDLSKGLYKKKDGLRSIPLDIDWSWSPITIEQSNILEISLLVEDILL